MNPKFAAVAVVLLMLFSAVHFVTYDGAEKGVLLYEVNRTDADEGVSIHNYSSSEIDLKGYVISDGEGKVTFTKSFKLDAADTITIVRNIVEDSDFQGRYPTYTDGDKGVSIESKFNLATSGDDLYLYLGETMIDAFCFGDKTVSDCSFWHGDSFKFKSGYFALRISSGNTASDWMNYKNGITTNFFDPSIQFDATVTPFLFPESGGIPIYNAIEAAKDTVYITMYELTNKNLYGLLCDLEERKGDQHVDVVVLLEADPLGYTSFSSDSRYMKALIDAGGEIYFIGGSSSDRYTYVHAKYCIIDSETVIVTSENWTTGNLSGKLTADPYSSPNNRGWGAVVASKEYASYMEKVFWTDLDTNMSDIISFQDYVITVEPAETSYKAPTDEYESITVSAKVTPVMSPDSSGNAFNYYIDNAKTRVYSEQQSITSSFANITTESPIKHMAQAADRGVSAKFILNSSNDEGDAKTQVDKINLTSRIQACNMSDPYVHNKGLICDDISLVSSINWTSTSINNNREMAVAIHSIEVSDFFAESFSKDFDRNYTYSGLDVKLTQGEKHYSSGKDIIFSVSVSQKGTFTYQWDLNGTVKTTNIPRTSYSLDNGDYTLKVTVTDTNGAKGLITHAFTVGDSPSDPGSTSILDKIGAYLAPIIAVILAAFVGITRLGGKKR